MRHDMNKRKVSSINDKSCGQKKEESREKELVQVSRPSPDQGRTPTLGCTKSFRVKLELELKAQPGKARGKRQEKGEEASRRRRRSEKRVEKLIDKGVKRIKA